MKRLIFILVFSSHSFADQIIEKFQAANSRYNDSDYIGAIQLYEQIVSEKWQSGYLYYNLGNSYFREAVTAGWLSSNSDLSKKWRCGLVIVRFVPSTIISTFL